MAARSTQITIINGTECQMQYKSSHLSHGVWNGGPDINVEPGSIRVVAQNDSDGLATGAEGWISYDLVYDQGGEPIGSVKINWDNPFVGSNEYSSAVAGPGFAICYCGKTGSGDNAEVTFMICQASR